MTVEELEDDIDEVAEGPLLASVAVVELFGRYDYEIVMPRDETGAPGRLLLLYGENGSGKTTVLKLLWNLLSPADDRGHRTAVARIPFRSVNLVFADGSSIRAEKSDALMGSFRVTLTRPARDDVVVRFDADEDGVVRTHRPDFLVDPDLVHMDPERHDAYERAREAWMANRYAEDEYTAFLESSRINPLFLADDRSLYTDDEEIERARGRAEAHSQAVGPPVRERATTVVERELRLTIGRVNEQLRSLTIAGQSQGSMGANSIYGDVLRRLAALPEGEGPEPAPDSTENSAAELLESLAVNSPRFEEFQLVPHFDASEFMSLLDKVPESRKTIAQDILVPYLNSLQARMLALKDAESLLRALLTLLNQFLVDKRFTFSPRVGLRIITRDGERLLPTSLSSGERQLTMLLCTTVLARRSSRLFIIDEPELSLGIPWQREILRALLALTEGTSLQFVVATHSVEMISSERSNLVRLERQSNVGRG